MEKYFEVKQGSKLYNDSFTYVDDYKKTVAAFKQICEEFGIETTGFYPCKEYLHIDPTRQDVQKFSEYLLKNSIGVFKKNSPQSKRWRELTKDIQFFYKPQLIYYMDFDAGHWSERLFNVNEKLYASIKTDRNTEIPLPEFAVEMKASDFYKIIEEVAGNAAIYY